MPLYRYRALYPSGTLTTGTLFGATKTDVEDILARMNLMVLSVRRRRVGQKALQWQFLQFFQYLSFFLKQSTPLMDALSLIESAVPPLKEPLAALRESLTKGHTFSEALQETGFLMDPVVFLLLRVSEKTGSLENACAHIYIYTLNQDQKRQKMQTALRYPCMLGVLFLGVLTIICFFFIPELKPFLQGNSKELPWETHFLFWISEGGFAWAGVGCFVLGAAVWFGSSWNMVRTFFVRCALKSSATNWMMQYRLYAPLFQNLAVMSANNVSLLEALETVQTYPHHPFLRPLLTESVQRLKQGVGVAQALTVLEGLPPTCLHILSLGEATNKLTHAFESVEALLEQRYKTHDDQMQTWMQPVLLLGMAAFLVLMFNGLFAPLQSHWTP